MPFKVNHRLIPSPELLMSDLFPDIKSNPSYDEKLNLPMYFPIIFQFSLMDRQNSEYSRSNWRCKTPKLSTSVKNSK